MLSHADSFRPRELYPTRLLCPWEFSRQEYWSGLSCPPSGDPPNPGIKPRSPSLQVDYSWSEPLGKPVCNISSVQSLSRIQLFVTPWTTACWASMCITNSRNLPKLMSIESVMPSNHVILCRSLLLLPSIFPNIRIFSNESALHIRWPKYWRFNLHIRKTAQLKYKVFLKYQIFLKFYYL